MEMNKPTILIVDDEERTRKILKMNLQDRYRILLARNGEEAVHYLQHETVHLVLSDLRMPGMDGLALLAYVREHFPHIPVIMITAFGSIETAVKAMKMGAHDYIVKPIKLDELEVLLEKSLNYGQLLQENLSLKSRLKQYEGMPEIVSVNPKIREILERIKQVAPTDATILIEGESGTGKALFARAVHYFSPRADKPFLEINCGAIPHDLLESELFGHEKGAFTGAVATKKGKFELASGGTLFLDEIGEMPLDLQVKLLHILENQTFTRIGGTQLITTDTRIVAATNRNLRQEVQNGRFREDLYYRLRVVYFHIPPLRERKEDIPLLIQHFIEKHQPVVKKTITGVDDAALSVLTSYPWPGNVRELENAILQAMIFTQSDVITVQALPEEIRQYNAHRSEAFPLTKQAFQELKNQEVENILNKLEYEFLTHLLQKTRGNISEAARQSGYDRRQLQNLIKKHRINVENFK